MHKKMSYKRLSSMWENSVTCNNRVGYSDNSNLKGSLDDLCFQAELAETTWDYAYVLCRGMKRLLRMGIHDGLLTGHRNLMQKLIYLGRDLMQTSSINMDLFYLGILIELKIYSQWRDQTFYQFLINALKTIKKRASFISVKIKKKLIERLQLMNLGLYEQFIKKKATGIFFNETLRRTI